MFCSQCGAEHQSTGRFCQKCGAAVSGVPAQAAASVHSQTAESTIWNPNAAANWSLIFTPAFGAYLQMLNWRVLGEPEKAASSQNWFYVGLGVLVVYILMGLFMSDPKTADGAAGGLGFLFLLVWYFSAGRAQGKYIKGKFGKTYARKPWGKALLISVGAIVGYFIAAVVIGLAYSSFSAKAVATANTKSPAHVSSPTVQRDVTGKPTWSGNHFDRFDSVDKITQRAMQIPGIAEQRAWAAVLEWQQNKMKVGEVPANEALHDAVAMVLESLNSQGVCRPGKEFPGGYTEVVCDR